MTLKKEKAKYVPPEKSTDARTTFVEHDDGKFIRSAYMISEAGSIAIVDSKGIRIGLINIMCGNNDGPLMVDVIDVDRAWEKRQALGFPNSERECIELEASTIVAAHFEGRKR